MLADTKGIRDGIGQTDKQLSGLQGGLKKTTSFVKGMVGGFLALQGAKAAIGFLGDAIGKASDLNETVNKSNTIFGANAKAVNAWSKNASTSVGLSRAAALEAASGFGNMFTQLGFTGEAAAKLSTSTVQMAADLGSFNNLPTADVADKISGAMRGEYDSLQTLIPNINAARVEQEAMAATGKTNASELTAQEKAAAVLAIVHKDGAAAMGDFAKTSGGLANQQKILKAKFEDTQAAIGQKLLPIMTSLASFVLDKVVPALSSMGDFLQKNAGWIIPLVAAIGTAVAVVKVWTIAQGIFNAVMALNPFVLIIAGIVALVAGLIYAWKNSETFRNIVIGVWNAIRGAVMAVLNWFTKTLWPGIQAVFNGIVTAVKWVFNMYVSIWTAIINFVRGVPGKIMAFFSGIAGWFGRVWTSIKNGAVTGFNNVVSFVRGVPGSILRALGNFGGLLVSAGRNLLEGLWNGIKGAGSWLKGKIKSFLVGLVPGWARDFLGIHSPSTVFAELGKFVTQGLAVGITDNRALRMVKNAAGSLGDTVVGGFNSPQLAVAGSGAGRGGNTYNVTVQVPPGTDLVAAGKVFKNAIAEYERVNGR